MTELYRFADGRGDRLELGGRGPVVTWRVCPLGVHQPVVVTRTEIARDADDAEVVMAEIEREHRERGFGDLAPAAVEHEIANLAPNAAWRRLTVATFADAYAWFGAGIAKLAARVREVRPDRRVLLDGRVELDFELPHAYEPPREPVEEALFAACKRDAAAREVYADWLEERGRTARAQWVRRAKPGARDREDDPEVVRAYWSRHASVVARRHGRTNPLYDDVLDEVWLAPDVAPDPAPELDVVQWVMHDVRAKRHWFLAADGTLRGWSARTGAGKPLDGSLGDVFIDRVLGLGR